MFKGLIVSVLSLLSCNAFAYWQVNTVYDELTDKIDYYELEGESQTGEGWFYFVCYANGSNRVEIFNKEYIGLTSGAMVKVAVDGNVQTIKPISENMSYADHFMSLTYTESGVDWIKDGKEMRVRVEHRHKNSMVYKYDLNGFVDAYEQFEELCVEFK